MTGATPDRVHAVRDDALGSHDAVALAALVRAGELHPAELAAAAAERARAVDGRLNAIAFDAATSPGPRVGAADGALAGVPTYVKDNTDVAGMPSQHGSEAYHASPAARDGVYTRQFLGTGLTVLGKTRMPEFGFNASTEFMTQEPTRNPWDLTRSVGASSGGAAALVASGAVPIAHANDGGGSIRIPAACAGLVGLKPSRGRHLDGEQSRHLPIKMVSEGVLTRTVRDTAAFVAAMEDVWRSTSLAPIGLVTGPASRRMRIGLITSTVTDALVDEQTRRAVVRTAQALEKAGHEIEPIDPPVTAQFAEDFVQFWSLLAELAADSARLVLSRSFDRTRTDGLTLALRAHHRRRMHHTPGALLRLRRAAEQCARRVSRYEAVLSPVVTTTTPLLGHLSPTVGGEELIHRVVSWVGFTPLHNITGQPAISLPTGRTDDGLPVGVMLSAAHGDERTLLELAYLLESELPFPRIESART